MATPGMPGEESPRNIAADWQKLAIPVTIRRPWQVFLEDIEYKLAEAEANAAAQASPDQDDEACEIPRKQLASVQAHGARSSFQALPEDVQHSYSEVSLMELSAYVCWRRAQDKDDLADAWTGLAGDLHEDDLADAWDNLDSERKSEWVPDESHAVLASDGSYAFLLASGAPRAGTEDGAVTESFRGEEPAENEDVGAPSAGTASEGVGDPERGLKSACATEERLGDMDLETVRSMLADFRKGSVSASETTAGVTALVALGRERGLEEALLSALPYALTKAPEARGDFEKFVFNQLDARLNVAAFPADAPASQETQAAEAPAEAPAAGVTLAEEATATAPADAASEAEPEDGDDEPKAGGTAPAATSEATALQAEAAAEAPAQASADASAAPAAEAPAEASADASSDASAAPVAEAPAEASAETAAEAPAEAAAEAPAAELQAEASAAAGDASAAPAKEAEARAEEDKSDEELDTRPLSDLAARQPPIAPIQAAQAALSALWGHPVPREEQKRGSGGKKPRRTRRIPSADGSAGESLEAGIRAPKRSRRLRKKVPASDVSFEEPSDVSVEEQSDVGTSRLRRSSRLLNKDTDCAPSSQQACRVLSSGASAGEPQQHLATPSHRSRPSTEKKVPTMCHACCNAGSHKKHTCGLGGPSAASAQAKAAEEDGDDEDAEQSEESDEEDKEEGEDYEEEEVSEEEEESVRKKPAIGKKQVRKKPAMSKAPKPQSKLERPAQRQALDAVCCVCGGDHATDKDDLGLCDRCDRAFHQSCHDPPVRSFGPLDSQWFCADCDRELREPSLAVRGGKAKMRKLRIKEEQEELCRQLVQTRALIEAAERRQQSLERHGRSLGLQAEQLQQRHPAREFLEAPPSRTRPRGQPARETVAMSEQAKAPTPRKRPQGRPPRVAVPMAMQDEAPTPRKRPRAKQPREAVAMSAQEKAKLSEQLQALGQELSEVTSRAMTSA